MTAVHRVDDPMTSPFQLRELDRDGLVGRSFGHPSLASALAELRLLRELHPSWYVAGRHRLVVVDADGRVIDAAAIPAALLPEWSAYVDEPPMPDAATTSFPSSAGGRVAAGAADQIGAIHA